MAIPLIEVLRRHRCIGRRDGLFTVSVVT